MSDIFLGNVESSSNLGIIRSYGNKVKITTEIRGNHIFSREEIENKVKLVAAIFGGTSRTHSRYPEWKYQKNSPLRKIVLETYYKKQQKEMECVSVHAGNEVGILLEKLNIEDAVAIGPTRLFYHTPKEKLNIKSVERFEEFLKDILEQLTD